MRKSNDGIGWCILVLMVLAFSGCYSLKKATRDVAKAGSIYPELVAANCANLFPVKTLPPVIIPGKTTTDTVIVKGERIPCPPVTNPETGKTDTFWVDCPPSKTVYKDRVDTLRVEFENAARITSLRLQLDQLNKTHAITLEKVTSVTNGRNNWRNIAIGLIVLFGIGIFLKIKRII